MIRRVGAVALTIAACRAPDVSVGANLSRDAGAEILATCAPTSGEVERLPFGAIAAADLPATIELGGRRFARVFAAGFDGAAATGAAALAGTGFASGANAYEASLSEFGTEALAIADGRLRLGVRRKDSPDAGSTDRAYWGSEAMSTMQHTHGLFVARLRGPNARQVQLGFLLTHDERSSAGASLGWMGPVMQLTDDPRELKAIWHVSSSGRHDVATIDTPATDADRVYALLAEPGHVAFFIDGQRVHQWRDAETASPWTVRFTHWIVKPGTAAFDDSVLPAVAELDFVAAYALDGCR